MPLRKGSSKEVISQNIREMVAAGHPPRVAVAAALSTADRSKMGKYVPPSKPMRDPAKVFRGHEGLARATKGDPVPGQREHEGVSRFKDGPHKSLTNRAKNRV